MLWLWPRASTTRTTGATIRPATWGGGSCYHRCCSGLDTAVEQPHHTFDHGDVGVVAAVPVERADQLLADQHGSRLQACRPVASACGWGR